MSTPAREIDAKLFGRATERIRSAWKGVRKELRLRDRKDFMRRQQAAAMNKYGDLPPTTPQAQ